MTAAGDRPDRQARAARRWELRSCGWHGHLTYDPLDRPDLAERLSVRTPQGQAWRCLRCGDYVLGPAQASGPTDHAPTPLRGRALRDAFIMRVLAIERWSRSAVLFAVAYGVWQFDGAKDSLQRVFVHYLPVIQDTADRLHVNVTESTPMRVVNTALLTGHRTLMMIIAGVLVYASIQVAEGVGLWVLRRWGEYVAVVGTSFFLPYELYDLAESITVLRVLTFAVNLALVVWLLWTKRLFGIHGGRAAHEAERESASILGLEEAAS